MYTAGLGLFYKEQENCEMISGSGPLITESTALLTCDNLLKFENGKFMGIKNESVEKFRIRFKIASRVKKSVVKTRYYSHCLMFISAVALSRNIIIHNYHVKLYKLHLNSSDSYNL